MSEGSKLPISQSALEALLDPKGQKGVQWRMQKLSVIRKLVKEGKSNAWVVWFLRTRTGLTPATARSLVEDAFLEEPKGEAEDGPLMLFPTGKPPVRLLVSRELRGKDVAAARKHSTSPKSKRTKR